MKQTAKQSKSVKTTSPQTPPIKMTKMYDWLKVRQEEGLDDFDISK